MARRVLIVGGGIVGLSTAWWAVRAGLDVTVIDQGARESAGCSQGNAGMVVPSHLVPLAAPGMVRLGLRYLLRPGSPFSIRPRLSGDLLSFALRFWRASNAAHVARAAPLLRNLHLASRRHFEEWDALWDHAFGFTKRGLLMLCRTAHGLAEETRMAALARGLGVPAEVLSPGETARVEPGLQMDVVGSIYHPLDCHLDPARLMAALRRDAEQMGVTLRWETSAHGCRTRGPRVEALTTTAGDIEADEFVLAAGVWSTSLARTLGVHIPMQAGKGYSLTLGEPRRQPAVCAILSEARVAVTPMGGALRVAGTLELTGLDTRIARRRVDGIVSAFTRYLPDFAIDDFRDVPVWCGLRPCSPDGLPYVGRFARYANLSAAAGHAMMGVSLGPATGCLMAEILCGIEPSLDIRALAPDRFA